MAAIPSIIIFNKIPIYFEIVFVSNFFRSCSCPIVGCVLVTETLVSLSTNGSTIAVSLNLKPFDSRSSKRISFATHERNNTERQTLNSAVLTIFICSRLHII